MGLMDLICNNITSHLFRNRLAITQVIIVCVHIVNYLCKVCLESSILDNSDNSSDI